MGGSSERGESVGHQRFVFFHQIIFNRKLYIVERFSQFFDEATSDPKTSFTILPKTLFERYLTNRFQVLLK